MKADNERFFIRQPVARQRSQRTLWICVWLLVIAGLLPVPGQAQDFTVTGRLHMDAFLAAKDGVDFSNGFHNRRARLGAGGELGNRWYGIVTIDFSESSFTPKDVYFRRSFESPGRLWLGQFKVPQGLNTLTSSNSIRFIERSTPSNIITDSRRLGIAYEYYGPTAGIKTMIYGRSIGSSLQGNMPVGGALRGVYAPHIGEARLHIGASFTHELRMDEKQIRLSDRPEARDSRGGRALIGMELNDTESTVKSGAELAWISGSWSLEAEYLRMQVQTTPGDRHTIQGWHAQTVYLLTGESFDYAFNGLSGVTPGGEGGAWELAARYSDMRLGDGALTGGRQRNVTLGVNHYVTANLRFMGNVIRAQVIDSPLLPDGVNEATPVMGLLRAQYHF